MKTKKIVITLLSLLCACAMSIAIAQTNDNVPKQSLDTDNIAKIPKEPYKVIFGVYPVALYEFDMANNSFKINFHAWWRTKDKDYHPDRSIEITNATQYNMRVGERIKNGDFYSTTVHIYATIRHFWDSTHFPFDRQKLHVDLEDAADVRALIFVPDLAYSMLHSEFVLPNWTVDDFKVEEATTKYGTNFGNMASDTELYSRLTFIIDIKHHGWSAYFDYFVAFFIAAFLSVLQFFIIGEPFPAKMTVMIGSVFAFIGNKYVLKTLNLSPTGYSLYGLIQSATFFMLICTVLVVVLLEFLLKNDEKKRAMFSYSAGTILGFAYILTVGTATFLAVIS